jgi:HK97 family phage prohead protease
MAKAKYNADQLKALQAKGHTFPGGTSYPIDDAEDLDNAIHAVGRGNADHDAIRKYVIGRAKALGLSSKIPDGWNADGSITAAKSANPAGDHRDDPTSEDYEMGYGLSSLKGSIARVKATQLADPDNKTDPDDEAVMAAIEKAEAAIDEAIVAQGKDSKREPRQKNAAGWHPATAKRAFASLLERATPHVANIEIRMDDGDGSDPNIAHFDGYAYTIDERYSVKDWLGEYKEAIGPGASSKTLRESADIPLLFNHDGIPLASSASKTSRLSDDGHGLRNSALLDRGDGNTNSICVQLRRGVLHKMSFSFRGVVEDWNDAYDDRYVRELQLFDTSIVTFPANEKTSAQLVDAVRSAMGREGRSLWLADGELSVRSALPIFVERREVSADADDLLERALRALAHADEIVTRSLGPYGRARTFLVAQSLAELRAGKTLSAANEKLLNSALTALSSADKAHAKLSAAHATASDAISNALNSSAPKDAPSSASSGASDGKSTGTPPGNGNPINPQDGAGPRSAALKLRREREAELRALRQS